MDWSGVDWSGVAPLREGTHDNDLLSMRSAGIKTWPGVATCVSVLTAFWQRTVTSYE